MDIKKCLTSSWQTYDECAKGCDRSFRERSNSYI